MGLRPRSFIIILIISLVLGTTFSIVLPYKSVKADEAASSATVAFTTQETTSDTVDQTEGGEVELVTETGSTASVSFPSEAVTASADVSINSINETDIASITPIPSGLNVVSDLVYDFKAEADGQTITTFDQPVTLTFTYTDAQISGLDEGSVRVYYWDTTQEDWIIFSDYTLDVANNTITINTDHFTLFAIMASSAPSPSPSGGGGGGGGGGGWVTPTTKVILQGKAYPSAEITILKDGQVATMITADSQANFKITLTTLTAGTYTFGLWTKDKEGRRSITFSFTVTVTSGITTTILDIFIPPTIELKKTGVARGQTLNILGQSAPQSKITIKINSPGEIIKTTTSTSEGNWNYSLNTSLLEDGVHYAKAKAATDDGLESSYSKVLVFYVGKEVAPGKVKTADISEDVRVNLVDFSILLYNWGTPKNTKADLNDDGWVNLVDFSIMMHQWTG